MKKSFATFAFAALAATSASAADLGRPAPAAVDYVKVCDAYGEGFFYIPGSQTCLKIGGYVRAEYRVFDTDNTFGAAYGTNNGLGGPTGNRMTTLARAQLTFDTRTNTDFGLLRTFTEIWYTVTSGSATPALTVWKAYIQYGGLTAGRAQSFFDFYTGDHWSSVYETAHSDSVVNLLAYTFAFGNGITATLSLEDQTNGNASRRFDALSGIVPPIDAPRFSYGGNKYLDVVGNVNISQAWGSAQIMAAAHHNQAAVNRDKWGYAVGAGATIKLPMLGAGDTFSIQGAYTKGAISYATPDPLFAQDFGVTLGGSLRQSTAWSVAAGLTHNWNAAWSSGATVSYLDVDHIGGGFFDYKQVDAGANLVYAAAPGLTIGVGVEYKLVDLKALNRDIDSVVGMLRIQRNF